MTIGTATYDDGTGAADYNLIWDNDNNGNSVVWLDYSNDKASWYDQKSWASGLNASGVLSYNIHPGFSVEWGANAWRLPDILTDFGAGYNRTASEMGHLYYNELGLKSYIDRGNKFVTLDGLKVSDFDNLIADLYWYLNEEVEDFGGHIGSSYNFGMNDGVQFYEYNDNTRYGLSVRNAHISAVPEPGAFWLVGIGLACLISMGVRNRKHT
jgi:hypothetical protein